MEFGAIVALGKLRNRSRRLPIESSVLTFLDYLASFLTTKSVKHKRNYFASLRSPYKSIQHTLALPQNPMLLIITAFWGAYGIYLLDWNRIA